MNCKITSIKWFNHYQKLINKNRQNNKIPFLTELHHIIPKCLGGTDDENNLVHLPNREHFIAHQMLAKIYPNHFGITAAAILMSSRGSLNSKKYSWLREQFSKIQSSERLDNSERMRKISLTLTGRTKETHQYLAEMGIKTSLRMKGQTKENCDRVRKHSINLSKSMTGKTKETDKRLANASKTLTETMSVLKKIDCLAIVELYKNGQTINEIFLKYKELNSKVTRRKQIEKAYQRGLDYLNSV